MSEPLLDLAASFRRALRADGRAERTATIYVQSVRFFAVWLAEAGPARHGRRADARLIRTWLAELAETHAPGTVRTRWKGLWRFCGWLVGEGLLDAHPMTGMEAPAAKPPPIPVLTDDDLSALIKACVGSRWYEHRDESIIRLLLDTGIRVSELCGIKTGDIDLDREMALVTGKGSKIRPVYFGARTARALDRYERDRRRHRWAHLDALFLGERGALTPDGARKLVAYRGQLAGITGRLHPHRFRHTFAHDFLMAGGQERDLKRLAGWSSDVMLERYGASAADVRAREAAKRLRRGDRV